MTTSAALAGAGVGSGAAVGLGVAVGPGVAAGFAVGATLRVGFDRGVLTGLGVGCGAGVAGITAAPLSATVTGARVESLAIVNAPLSAPLVFGAAALFPAKKCKHHDVECLCEIRRRII